MSYRRLWVLVRQLPPESATQTALRDEDLEGDLDDLIATEPEEQRFGAWSHQDYLLAQLIDAVRENTYVSSIAGQLEPKPDPPRPFPRPGVRRKSVQPALSEAAVIYLNERRAPRG